MLHKSINPAASLLVLVSFGLDPTRSGGDEQTRQTLLLLSSVLHSSSSSSSSGCCAAHSFHVDCCHTHTCTHTDSRRKQLPTALCQPACRHESRRSERKIPFSVLVFVGCCQGRRPEWHIPRSGPFRWMAVSRANDPLTPAFSFPAGLRVPS